MIILSIPIDDMTTGFKIFFHQSTDFLSQHIINGNGYIMCLWDFKVNTQLFPWEVSEMFEMFVGVRAEF